MDDIDYVKFTTHVRKKQILPRNVILIIFHNDRGRSNLLPCPLSTLRHCPVSSQFPYIGIAFFSKCFRS